MRGINGLPKTRRSTANRSRTSTDSGTTKKMNGKPESQYHIMQKPSEKMNEKVTGKTAIGVAVGRMQRK